jgi:transcriptional regulator of acetoin/glycerol metabolism
VPSSLEQTEHDAIVRSLQQAHGNVAVAARSLGISRSTLYRKIGRYGLDRLAAS